MPWWLLFLGCTSPKLEGVSPAAVWAGDPLTLRGADLRPDVRATLSQGEQRLPLPLTELTETGARAVVPADLPVGFWEISLQGESWPAPEGVASFEVWTPETEPACTKRYALRTETSRLRHAVGVDRIVPGRPTEELRFEATDLAKLHHVVTGACHAIWLETLDGRKVLLADDDSADLSAQARTMSEVLAVELVSP